IKVCRESPSRDEAKTRLQQMAVSAGLMERALGADNFRALVREIGQLLSYHMTEAQAEAVVRMQLGQLARLQSDEILKEYNDLRTKIRSYEELLSSDENVRAVIKKDLKELRSRYGDPRRTDIEGDVAYLAREDLIAEEDNAVTLSHGGYIKRLPPDTHPPPDRRR